MRIDIVTLFPELCDGFLSTSILGRARAKNLFEAHCQRSRLRYFRYSLARIVTIMQDGRIHPAVAKIGRAHV